MEWAISKSKSVKEVKTRMEKQGYQVELARGIAITDDKAVRFKGSELGYPLAKIEKELIQQQIKEQQQKQEKLSQQQEVLKQERAREHESSERKQSHGLTR
ncbi:hypothetical protein [Pedobacter sp. NJ-S-72]